MKLTIHHMSENGNRKIKIIQDVKGILYDYGFELHGKHTPAVKILTSTNPYFLLEVHEPEKLVLALRKCEKDVELGINIFDPDRISLKEALSLLYDVDVHHYMKKVFRSSTEMKTYKDKDAFRLFSHVEFEKLSVLNLRPLLNKSVTQLAGLWAATLPTPCRPSNVSKNQYFHALLSNYRRSHERFDLPLL